jgi:hypothetical protein
MKTFHYFTSLISPFTSPEGMCLKNLGLDMENHIQRLQSPPPIFLRCWKVIENYMMDAQLSHTNKSNKIILVLDSTLYQQCMSPLTVMNVAYSSRRLSSFFCRSATLVSRFFTKLVPSNLHLKYCFHSAFEKTVTGKSVNKSNAHTQ